MIAQDIGQENTRPEKAPARGIDLMDLLILNVLQEDSRLSFNKIALQLGISVGTAFNHVKKLEHEGIIKSYTIVVDAAKMGFNLTALILVQAIGGHLAELESDISKEPCVVAVYDITGDYDAALITKFRDRAELNIFIKTLLATPHVKRTVTSVVLDVVKEDLRLQIRE
jgi:DNA-binding Lrp family transcriptional regulator